MTNTKFRVSPLLLGILMAAAFALPVLAQNPANPPAPDPTYGLNTTGGAAGFDTSQDKSDLNRIMGLVINWGFTMFGFVFFMFMLVGGYLWLTAGSNEEKVNKAKTIIGTSISGLLIVFMAYALARAVVDALIIATT